MVSIDCQGRQHVHEARSLARDARAGVSLVGMLIAALIGVIVLTATFRVLHTNQRAFGVQSVQVRDRQTLRAGIALLNAELREISPGDGDLITMEPAAMHVRSPGALGLVCEIESWGTDPEVKATKVGRYLREDSARVFYENETRRDADDVWRTGRIEVLDTTGSLSCPDGRTAQRVRLHEVSQGAPPDSISPGALVRVVRHFEYELAQDGGLHYLIRTPGAGDAQPLVGPLDAESGVRFRYLDADGVETAVAADVRQIEVTLRTVSGFRDGDEQLQDSLTTVVHTRNSS